MAFMVFMAFMARSGEKVEVAMLGIQKGIGSRAIRAKTRAS